jgi:hypothetical protein
VATERVAATDRVLATDRVVATERAAATDGAVAAEGMVAALVTAHCSPGARTELCPDRASSRVETLSPGRYRLQLTVGIECRNKLERLAALLGRGGTLDLGAAVELAIAETLARVEARRFALVRTPRFATAAAGTKVSRHIPAALKRAVYARDGGRCSYVGRSGKRCPEISRLEYHHHHPFALGGGHELSTLRLMCQTHNAYYADRDYGREVMARHRARRLPSPPAT